MLGDKDADAGLSLDIIGAATDAAGTNVVPNISVSTRLPDIPPTEASEAASNCDGGLRATAAVAQLLIPALDVNVAATVAADATYWSSVVSPQ
jgi:hypothetical protein